MDILIVWVSRRYVQTYRYVWNSNLTILSSKIDHLQYSRYQPSQMFHIIKPNDCKNLTFDAVSFLVLNDRIFLIVVPLTKIMSLVRFTCLFRTSNSRCVLLYRCRLHTCNLWFLLHENRIIIHLLIHNAKLRSYSIRWLEGKWSVSVFLISYILAGGTLGENSYIVLRLLYVPVITLHSIWMIFTLIEWYSWIRLIRVTVVTPAHDSMKIPTAIQYCEIWWNLFNKRIFLLAWIINDSTVHPLCEAFSLSQHH